MALLHQSLRLMVTPRASRLLQVLQGDALSPFLFIILMDYILRQTLSDETGFVVRKSRSTRFLAKYIHALAYADDIALISESADSAEPVLRNLELNSQQIGLLLMRRRSRLSILDMFFNNATYLYQTE